MSDLLRTVAFAYRRKGTTAMTGLDLRHLLAFDLRWFAPEDAKRAVARAMEAGLIREDGEKLSITFDQAVVQVPVGFRPAATLFDEPLPERPSAPPPDAAKPDAAAASRAPVPAPSAPIAPVPAPSAPIAPVPAPSAPTPSAPTAPPPPADPLEKEIMAEQKRRAGLLTPEVARLVVERRHGADVTERARALEAQMLGD